MWQKLGPFVPNFGYGVVFQMRAVHVGVCYCMLRLSIHLVAIIKMVRSASCKQFIGNRHLELLKVSIPSEDKSTVSEQTIISSMSKGPRSC